MGNTVPMKKHIKPEIVSSRPFGTNPGQEETPKQELKSTLFLKLGTKVATVTAHYEHLPAPEVPQYAQIRKVPRPVYTPNVTYANVSTDTTLALSKFSNKKEATILGVNEPIYEDMRSFQ